MLPVSSHASVTTGLLSVAAAEMVVMFAPMLPRTLLLHRIAVLLRPASRAVLLLTLLTPAHAQTTASIEGQVVDQLGAVIANAQITIHNRSTGTDRTTSSDEAGRYQLAALPVGEYRIEVTSRGFQTQIVDRLTVEVARKITQNFLLLAGDLPLDSVVLFRESTFWELYKWRILGVGALLLLQTSLIAGLLIERARRSKATHGLSESEERYRNVVQTQTELICRYLPDTTITFVNDAYCRYFGKSRAELIGSKFIELIPEHARQDTLLYVRSLLKNPRIQSNEHQAILADGSITWQHWIDHVFTNGNGRVKELQGIGRDITERKLAEEALQISERRFATAFSANPQPMSLTTLVEGRYIDVNEGFLQMSGYTREEVIGNTSLGLGIFQKTEDREKLVGPLRDGQSVRNLELMFRTKQGEFRILLSSAEVIDLGGQQCVLVASSDITDRKRLEEERLNAENELSQLTARLFTLQDEERRRIARELHDGTAQNLFAISIDIDLMRKQAANGDSELNSLLDESASLCEQSLQEIRTLSYLLHPPLLDHAGLVSALQWYVDGFIKRSGIAVNLIALESVGRMGSQIEMALFRIVQESLTNIRRHSGSETAGIRLWRDNDEIFLEIQDHGHGIKLTDSIGPIDETYLLGVGIPGMRQRLRQLGGRLDIVTCPSGTVVKAVIPVTEAQANGASF